MLVSTRYATSGIMKFLFFLGFAILAANGQIDPPPPPPSDAVGIDGISRDYYWDYNCCPRNEMWVDCAPYCEATCDKPFSVTLPWYSRGGGCVCQPGYVRQYENGPCIKEKCCQSWCGDCYDSNCDWNNWYDRKDVQISGAQAVVN